MPTTADPKLLTETYNAIKGFIDAMGYPPTVRELGGVLGLSSSSSVQERLAALEEAGMVERVDGSPRALRLTLPSKGSVHTPEATEPASVEDSAWKPL